MGIIKDVVGGITASGADAANKAAGQQIAATNIGRADIESGRVASREVLDPFFEAGSTGLDDTAALITDPERQREFIGENPFFDALADDSQRRLFANEAARGKVGSGGTAEALQNSLVLLGDDLLTADVSRRMNLATLGLRAGEDIATVESRAGVSKANLAVGAGNAAAAGTIGEFNAQRGELNNAINTGLGLLDSGIFGNNNAGGGGNSAANTVSQAGGIFDSFGGGGDSAGGGGDGSALASLGGAAPVAEVFAGNATVTAGTGAGAVAAPAAVAAPTLASLGSGAASGTGVASIGTGTTAGIGTTAGAAELATTSVVTGSGAPAAAAPAAAEAAITAAGTEAGVLPGAGGAALGAGIVVAAAALVIMSARASESRDKSKTKAAFAAGNADFSTLSTSPAGIEGYSFTPTTGKGAGTEVFIHPDALADIQSGRLRKRTRLADAGDGLPGFYDSRLGIITSADLENEGFTRFLTEIDTKGGEITADQKAKLDKFLEASPARATIPTVMGALIAQNSGGGSDR